MENYYTSQQHFEKTFEKTDRSYRFQAENKKEFDIWSRSLREKLHQLIGTDLMQRCDPNPVVVEEVSCQGYIRKKVLIHTEPDVVMPFYILIPEGLKSGEKRTAVIACHGHDSNGKSAVAGVREDKEVVRSIEEYNYNYGEILAQMGYVVFAPDARGMGERRERYFQGSTSKEKMSSSCDYLNAIAMPLGQTVTGMWVWDLMRLVDYALSSEYVKAHIACVGLSGGGLQSLWLGALDERIECCVVSGYFYGFRESLLIDFNCFCNYVPDLWRTVDIGDIGALVSPRPFLIETGDEDHLNGLSGLENVLPQVEVVRKAMKINGKEDHLFHDIFRGKHRWNGEHAYPWIMAHMPPIIEELSVKEKCF